MRYFVIATNGKKYGPADVDTLSEWANEGRLIRSTLVEGEDSGVQLPASTIAGIKFPASISAPISAPPVAASMAPSIATEKPLPLNYEFAPAMGSMGTSSTPGGFAAYPRTSVVSEQEVPKGFNWGACLLSFFWCIAHRKWPVVLGLICLRIGSQFVPGLVLALIQIAIAVGVGLHGNQWAWESGKYQSIEQMVAAQKSWARAGVIVLVILLLLIAVMGYMLINAPVKAELRRPM